MLKSECNCCWYAVRVHQVSLQCPVIHLFEKGILSMSQVILFCRQRKEWAIRLWGLWFYDNADRNMLWFVLYSLFKNAPFNRKKPWAAPYESKICSIKIKEHSNTNVHLYDCDGVHFTIKKGKVSLDNLIDLPLSLLKSLYSSLKSGTFSWNCEIIHFKCLYLVSAGSVEQLLLLPLSSWKGLWKQRNRK